jgi:nitroreductase
MKRIKNLILAAYDFVDSYLYDIWHYWHHSQAFARLRSRITARAYLMTTAHALEKGLAIQERRPGFGKAKCHELMEDTLRFQRLFGPDPVCLYVMDVVERVLDYHGSTGHTDTSLVAQFKSLKTAINQPQTSFDERGGLLPVRKQEILASAPSDPFRFFASRHSVRQFAEGKISEASIREAVRIAQRAPSVCNRQSCRLYYSTDPATIAVALAHQNGAAGFGEKAAAVFVATSELGAFNRAGERNQGYVDGGIFAATFALGMHALGFGTCFLNWSATARRDRKLRRALGIPDSEIIITLLVGGCLREEFAVAASPRLPLDDVIRCL